MKITKSILKQMIAEQMSEVFQSGITVQSPKQAHKYYVEAVKDYRAVAGKIQQMLPEEQKEKGEKAIFGTEYAIKETMKLVKFALENEGMSRQQKDELIEDLDSLDYEADDVKDILVLVNPTPEELENLVYDLIEKYEVANAYLMGILEGRYTDTSDADFEDAGKQMGLGLQEKEDLDEVAASSFDKRKQQIVRIHDGFVESLEVEGKFPIGEIPKSVIDALMNAAIVTADAIGGDLDEYSRVYQESKKDMLKRIVAEELAKMEIEAMEDSGELDEITFSSSGIDFSDKEGIRTSDDDMSVTGILSKMGNDSVEGQQAKGAMDKFLARHQGRAAKREQNKRDQFSAVKDAEERRFIGAAQKRAREQQAKIQGIRDSMKDGDINREDAVYIMSLDGSDDLKDYNDDAVQPRDKIGS